jgi:hypothetical protein
MGDIDARIHEAIAGLLAECVVPYSRNKRDIAAKPGGGYCLVGAFAAWDHGENAAENGFAGFGEAGATDDHISVAAADYDNFGLVVHFR